MTSVLLRQFFQMLDLLEFGIFGMWPYLFTLQKKIVGNCSALVTNSNPIGSHLDFISMRIQRQVWGSNVEFLQIPEVNLRTGGSSKCIPGIRSALSMNPGDIPLPSGKLTVCYWKMAIEIVDFPIKDGDFP